MAKLQPDYIKWVLTLNASQAQEEYHKLQKENKGLQKDADATRKRMAELAGQSKANTQEYKNLETRLKSLTKIYKKSNELPRGNSSFEVPTRFELV
ncbi:MAG: hypothetical protein HDR48_06030 [Bacteroides sp.]|nr:hypothetical protein [Bacteroides sp.]